MDDPRTEETARRPGAAMRLGPGALAVERIAASLPGALAVERIAATCRLRDRAAGAKRLDAVFCAS